MKIGIIQPRLSYYNGGGEKYCMDSLLRLANKTKDTFIIYTTKNASKKSNLYRDFKKKLPNNILVREINIPKKWKKLYSIKPGINRYRWDAESLAFNKEIFPLILKEKIDLFWSYYILDSLILPPNVPCILNLLGYPRKKSDYMEGLLVQYSEIVSISENVINKWNELLDKKIKSYRILNQGIDPFKKFKQNPFSKNKFNIVFAGRFIERKGIHILIRAASKLINKRDKNIMIYLFGEGEYKEKIKKLIKKLKLEKNVKFFPFVKDVEKYFYFSDLCVFPSYSGEGLMSVVLESMYYNGLVISTEENGNEEAIINNKNGFLVSQGNIIVLSQKIKEIMKNPNEFESIRNEAKKTIEKKFTWDVYCNNFFKIIEKYKK